MLRSLSLICAFSFFSGLAQAQSLNIEAGPIWNQADANRKCPAIASSAHGRWTGQWRTTVPGKMSVCQVKMAPKKRAPSVVSAGYTSGGALMATTSLNVRTGPGVNYPKFSALRPYEQVTVNQCTQTGWCAINFRGRSGWVSNSYLGPIPARPVIPAVMPRQNVIIVEPSEPDIIIIEEDEPEIVIFEDDDTDVMIIEDGDDSIILIDD